MVSKLNVTESEIFQYFGSHVVMVEYINLKKDDVAETFGSMIFILNL